MPEQFHNDPLHGKTLKVILEALVDKFGWRKLSRIIEIRCFYNDPSIKSSLNFLRKTEWARKKVEELYIKECCSVILTDKRDVKREQKVTKQKAEEIPWFERRRLRKNEKK